MCRVDLSINVRNIEKSGLIHPIFMSDYPNLQKEIKVICLRLLAGRDHSQQELIAKLAMKGFDRIESQLIIDDLAAKGCQSDNRFAESYARSRIRKGFGPIKISYELQQRGIEFCDLNAVVMELADGWFHILERVYEKKYSNDSLLMDTEWLKRSRFLQQRGFSGDMIEKLFLNLNISLSRTEKEVNYFIK